MTMLTPPNRPLACDDSARQAWPIHVAHCEDHELPAAAGCRRPVTHSYAALAFFTAGRSRMEQNGRWDVRAGDVVLVPAGQPHRTLERQNAQYWGLSFCVPCVATLGAPSLLAPFERVRDGAAAVVHVSEARRPFLLALFDELASLATQTPREPDARAAVERSLLTLILSEVDRAAVALPALAAAGGGGVVAQSLRYIERNCLRPLTLQEVADAVGRSPAYLTSAVSRATGRSAVAWIVSGRMAEARRLLACSYETVDAIAQRVGYADATHFIRMFKRDSGQTPAAWRAAHALRPTAQ